ncbi:MAG TPA: PEGA domain-containing protein [Thermoanaerobaculia bacterium]|nr:PEGA domain-containing protein [Thermoanaerobaculia bacterium]
MTIRRAAKRLRELGAVPVFVAMLLLAASSAWAGHSGGGHSGGGHSGGGHSASHGGSHGGSHGSGGHGAGPSGIGAHHGNGGFHGGSHGSGGLHGHDGFHGNHGFHGRGYYPLGIGFDFGYWPGLYFGLGWGWGWGWDGWGWGYPYGYPYGYGPYGERYGYGYGGGYGGYDRSSRDDMGALDLDISPGDTQVYVNGEKLGTVDDFDGWPQYLWLPKGTYDIVFYREGYKTLARQVSVYPGLVIDMDDRLEHGQSILPQDLQTKTHERRDDRMRYEQERSDRIDRGQWDPRSRDDDNWRDRAHRRRDQRDENADRGDDSNGRMASSESGWLRLHVDPEDSSVYLDGRFVGTGSELGSMQNGLKVSPGKHHLAVVRPGRKSVERDFDATAGQDVKLSIDLANGR